ncbi:hypothetical protein ACQ86G_14450 [Roseateles chitinivorans]|uniref:hypothetical protein n=1 Tax=Roseateles chitinivorans TaxID=2917965 RepID=UPI003D66E0A4
MNTRSKPMIAGDWIRAAWPFTLVAGGGALWFGKDILHSIASTPHPALVYVILGALVAATVLAWLALHQMIGEEQTARAWRHLPPEHFASRLSLTRRASPFRDAYALVTEHAVHPKEMNRQELERRLEAAETAYAERLSLPGFIAGALVGLGLVGTFIGLLGALEDLAQLFSGMSAASGGDPAALFSGMLLKLQAPMKSMGTAFIASLYGLLGSLVLGLTLVAVNNTRLRVNATVHDAIFDAFAGIPLAPSNPACAPACQGIAAERLEAALQSLTAKLDEQAAALAGLRHPQLWLDAWSQMNDQLGRLREQEAATSQALLVSLRDQARNVERVAEASAAMQALMTQSAARDSHEDIDLRQALQDCRQSFEQVGGRLRSVLALQLDQCGRFEPGNVANDTPAGNTASATA